MGGMRGVEGSWMEVGRSKTCDIKAKVRTVGKINRMRNRGEVEASRN